MERTLNTGHSHGGIVTAYLQLAYDQRRVRHFHAILFFDKNRFKIQHHWKDFESTLQCYHDSLPQTCQLQFCDKTIHAQLIRRFSSFLWIILI